MTIVDPNTLARVELWDRAVKMFRSSPITGVGPGMFGKLIYDPKFTISIDPTVGRIHAHAHNTFLELLAETGLLGFCAYMYIFAVFFIGFFRSLKKGIDGLGRAVLVGIAGGVLATLILSLGTTIITVDLQDAVLFWLLAGVGFQLSKKGAHESEAVRP
jgi:O-antigen ligase